MESLVPDVAVVGLLGEGHREALWERQVWPMCVTRGRHCPSNAVGPALPVSGRACGLMGEWGILNRFLANKSCTTHQWNVLETDLPVLWVPQRANRRWLKRTGVGLAKAELAKRPAI